MTEATTYTSTDLVPSIDGVSAAVPDAEFARLLGFPRGAEIDAQSRDVMAYVRERFAAVARPWAQARVMDIEELTACAIHLHDGPVLNCQPMARRLADARAHALVIVGVSAGPEVVDEIDHRWQSSKPDSSYFLDALSSCVVERLILSTGIHLCDWGEPLGMAALPHYSPGYVGWPLREQRILLQLLKDAEALPGPMEALETGMLRPRKSQLAMFGLTRHGDLLARQPDLCPCVDCSLSPCAYRRMPQRISEPKPRKKKSSTAGTPAPQQTGTVAPGPSPGADAYGYPQKALERWSRDCLTLESLRDGGLRARFQYSGSTCGGAGADIIFEFEVKLGSPSDAHRILEASCAAPIGDERYKRACAYVVDPAALAKRMRDFQPLVGQPLDDVLTWDPDLKMSGCMCSSLDQAHKWRVALQAIHFGIKQRGTAAA